MPKSRKPYTTRRPPEPVDHHGEIEEWMTRGVMPTVKPIVAYLDEEIRAKIPDVHYAIKWGQAYYGTPEQGWIIELAAYHVSVNIVFLGGEDLEPPPPLGDTDRSRYVKIKSLEEARASKITEWIEQAASVPGWA